MKSKWKLHPGSYALGENEKFYGDMEAKGWRLVKRGARWSKFQRTEPSRARYRAEVVALEEAGGDLSEGRLAVYEDCGWEHVAGRGVLHFFRAPEGTDAPEFYQDPRQQAETLKGLRRRLAVSLVVSILLLALLVPVVVTVYGGTESFLARMRQLWLTAPGLPAFYCLLLFSELFISVLDAWQIGRTYNRLKKGIPLDHAPKGRGVLRLVLGNGLGWAADLCLVLVALQLVFMQRGDLPLEPDGPYIVLKDVGWEEDRSAFMGNDSEREHTRSVFAGYWNVREYLDYPDRGEIMLYQDVYRLSPWLDPMDWVRSLTANQTFVKDLEEYTPVEIEGLDAAWLVEGGMEAVAVKGRMMAYINYLDGAYSTERLEAVLKALSARWNKYD